MSEPFIGEIIIGGWNFAPRGFAFCNGQLLQIAQNTALFAVIGTTYGGDGRTTLGLPNLTDRTPVHPGNGPGLSQVRLGQRTGVSSVTLSEAQMPSHTHQLRASNGIGDTSTPSGATAYARPPGGRAGTTPFYGPAANLVAMNAAALPATGGSQSHENRQPFLELNYCIALTGIFPSRS